jgi:hypothetical protein
MRRRRRNIRIQVNPPGKDHGVSWGKHHLTAYQFFFLEHKFNDNVIETYAPIHYLIKNIIFMLPATRPAFCMLLVSSAHNTN